MPGVLPGPLDEPRPDPTVAALPKADLHLHQEQTPRLDRVLAARERRPAYDWRAWAERLMADRPAGMPRFAALSRTHPVPVEADADDELFVARLADLLEEAARDGAVLVEVRVGRETVLRPGFMDLFREAERRVRGRYPDLHAVAVNTVLLWLEPDRLEAVLEGTLAAARDGLGGIDLLYRPYDTEADWDVAYRVAARADDAGLGVTAHAGEFSTANIAAALRTPGLTRLGHAVHAVDDPRLLDLVAARGVTIECCLTCNVFFGAVPSFEEHPIGRLVQRGIPVALGADNPVQLGTTIGREYAVAAALGFSPADLLAFTRNAVRACFAPAALRSSLLAALSGGAGPILKRALSPTAGRRS
jgi:adenosine deaminase